MIKQKSLLVALVGAIGYWGLSAISSADPTGVAGGDSGIRLRNARVDTSANAQKARRGILKAQDKIAPDSAAMFSRQGAISQSFPFMIQFIGPVQQAWKQSVEQAGAQLGGYLPENAFMVQLTASQLPLVAALDCVQWVGPYQPVYKVDSTLNARIVGSHPVKGSVGAKGAPPGERLADGLEAGVKSEPDALDTFTIQTFSFSAVSTVRDAVLAQAGHVLSLAVSGKRGLIRVRLPVANVPAILGMPDVEFVEVYVAPKLHNNVGTDSEHMNIQSVWTNQYLTGIGQVVCVADTGLDSGDTNNMHPDFSNRVIAAFALGRPATNDWSDSTANGGHGTHVSGSVLGSGAAWSNGLFRGAAYEASLVMQSIMDAGGNLGGIPDPLANLFIQARASGARIHTDSWGSSVYGHYTSDSQSADQFMWDYRDMLVLFSAGNSGVDTNRDGVIDPTSIGAPGTAKNVLTVGAAESKRPFGSGGYSSYIWGVGSWNPHYNVNPIHDDLISTMWRAHQGMAAFSSRGPCVDGRTKPDIVAPGTDIVSCRSRMPGASAEWGTGVGVLANAASNYYTFSGGTSMSTPLTAGAAALVRQYLQEYGGFISPSAALMKAVMVNGARSLTPGQYGWDAYREIPGAARPNHVEGWGHVDLDNTLFPASGRTNVYYDVTNAADAMVTGKTNEYTFVATGANRVSITLCWADYPASLAAAFQLVNDLDLTVITPDQVTHYPHGLATADRLNNVEGVDVSSVTPGTITIRVVGYNVPNGPQPYAVVIHESGYSSLAVDAWVEPNRATNAGFITVKAAVTPSQASASTVSGHYRVNGGDWQAVSLSASGSVADGALYAGSIPGQTVGAVIDYYVGAQAGADAATSATNTYTVLGYLYYVATNGSATPPYDSLATAATNIQMAADAAVDGSLILIGPGTYKGTGSSVVLVTDKSLTLRSINGPDTTVIHGEGVRRGIYASHVMTVEGLTVTNGYSAGSGGGCYLASGTISNCQIRNCTSGASGGGAYLYGDVFDAVLENNVAVYGGGVRQFNGRQANVSAISNRATSGGGLYLTSITGSNLTAVGNQAGIYGGGLYVVGGALTGGTIASNGASSGGGVYGSCTLAGFAVNINTGVNGAGLYMEGLITNCNLVGNVGSGFGGGLYGVSSSIMADSYLADNQALDGGGIDSSGWVIRCTLTNNQCLRNGGGVYAESFSVVRECMMVNNVAWTNNGGGIYADADSLVSNCVIRGNTAVGAGGVQQNNASVVNCLIAGNSSTHSSAGGVYLEGLSADKLINCTVVDNTALGVAARVAGIESAAITMSTVAVRNCIVVSNTTVGQIVSNYSLFVALGMDNTCTSPTNAMMGDGCFDADPLFASPVVGNYRLQSGSPCSNVGTNLTWMPGANDLAGNSRIIAGRVDLGAYEYGNPVQVSASSLAFMATYGGSNPTGQSFAVTNLGESVVAYTVSSASPWVTVSPATVSLPVGSIQVHAVSVNVLNLPAGSHATTNRMVLSDTYDACEVAVALVVSKAGQSITFPAPGDQWTTSVVTLAATASSGLPVTYQVISGYAQLVGTNQLVFTLPGPVSVQADQAGDNNWNASDSVIRTFNVSTSATPTSTVTPTATSTPLVTVTPTAMVTPTPTPTLGFAGLAVYAEGQGLWQVMMTGAAVSYGLNWGGLGYQPVAADYDGDRHTDLAVYNRVNGLWVVRLSASGGALATAMFGGTGYEPIPRDFDGDAKADPALYQAAVGVWLVMQSGSGYAWAALSAFGGATWAPAPGDYDGDAKADPAVSDAALAVWAVRMSGSGYQQVSAVFGGAGATPAMDDYDGDGKADPAVYQESTGVWRVMLSGSGYAVSTVIFGGVGFMALPADVDGDGKSDYLVYQPATGFWAALLSRQGYAAAGTYFGGPGYTPVGAMR